MLIHYDVHIASVIITPAPTATILSLTTAMMDHHPDDNNPEVDRTKVSPI